MHIKKKKLHKLKLIMGYYKIIKKNKNSCIRLGLRVREALSLIYNFKIWVLFKKVISQLNDRVRNCGIS